MNQQITADQLNDAGHLMIGGCDSIELAQEYGTPLVAYDVSQIRQQIRSFRRVFDANHVDYAVSYASKAFAAIAMYQVAAAEGAHVDVVSAGELYTAINADFPIERVSFHGNNKSREELEMAIDHHVGTIMIDNFHEIKLLATVLEERNESVDVMLRITPGISAHTNKYIQTGQVDSKFGFDLQSGQADEALQKVLANPRMKMRGLHAHIGSQIFELAGFEGVAKKLVEVAAHWRDEFGYEIPSDKVGEYWAISAHPHGVSTIKNGRFAGMGLDQLYAEHRELFGNSSEPVFPLLTKILDANDWLSVQVHPDDHYAMEHEGELGKTECWYVIAADEGAEIIYGHNAKSREELRQQIEKKEWDKLLTKVPVKAGDFFYVPSGTMHAIGSGILILETQQSSDTTYRVYDFDRKDDEGNLRELHLEKSIDVLNIGAPANSRPVTVKADDLTSTLLVASDFFAVYKWEVSGKVDIEKTVAYLLVSVLAGRGVLTVDGETYPIAKGDHFILPSDVEEWTFEGQDLEMIVSHP